LGYIRGVAAGRKPKPEEKRRSKFLRIRLTPEQDAMIKDAAETAGITVSAWASERLLAAAKRERKLAEKE
jgi:uncharacterized protein (DUF1778 family)